MGNDRKAFKHGICIIESSSFAPWREISTPQIVAKAKQLHVYKMTDLEN